MLLWRNDRNVDGFFMTMVIIVFMCQLVPSLTEYADSEEDFEPDLRDFRPTLVLPRSFFNIQDFLKPFQNAMAEQSKKIAASFHNIVEGAMKQAKVRSRELAQKFAPELRHDRAGAGYPMSAQDYYAAMKADTSGKFFKENTDKSTMRSGNIPVYYMVRSDAKQTRINFWWFYGYQHPCWSDKGSHNGDWEHINVILTEDQNDIAAVSFYQHNQHYTRISGPRAAPCTPSGTGRCAGSHGFQKTGSHPIVYIGKYGHGSYHDSNSRGVEGAGACAYYADYRNPKSSDDYMEGWKKVIDLDGDDEAWIAADKKGGFSWGPDGVNTHPTSKSPFDSEHNKACEGSPTYRVDNAGCYQSECLAGDDEASEDCLKECEPGYTNVGLTCNKGKLPWEWKIYGRLTGGNKYGYSYTIPKSNAGLSRRRNSESEWDLP